ncbi:MAG: hypothetical protein IPM29_18605 [Planctomycetes bacterium]|nr:hypothetical protein [Planctomycetota bacterium]
MLHAAVTLALVGAATAAALRVHRRLRPFLPEDHPGPGRKAHPRPTPMLGAVPAVATVILAAAVVPAGSWWLALAVALAALTGAVDDVRKDAGGAGLGPAWKSAGLLGAAACGAVHATHAGDLQGPWAPVAIVLLVFVVTNAVNFLDNQDGVTIALGCGGLALLGVDGATIAAAWLALLPWNWPRARAFPGDAGAYALGCALATLAAARAVATPGDPAVQLRLAIAPVLVPLADFAQVVSVRLALGIAPWRGDRRHLTHRLLALGVPRAALAPLLAALAVGLGLLVSPS